MKWLVGKRPLSLQAKDCRRLKNKVVIFYFCADPNVRSTVRTAEFQTRETTVNGGQSAKQKETMQENASFANWSVLVNKAASGQKCCSTRIVVKISQRAAGNKPKNNGPELSMAGITTGLKRVSSEQKSGNFIVETEINTTSIQAITAETRCH